MPVQKCQEVTRLLVAELAIGAKLAHDSGLLSHPILAFE